MRRTTSDNERTRGCTAGVGWPKHPIIAHYSMHTCTDHRPGHLARAAQPHDPRHDLRYPSPLVAGLSQELRVVFGGHQLVQVGGNSHPYDNHSTRAIGISVDLPGLV